MKFRKKPSQELKRKYKLLQKMLFNELGQTASFDRRRDITSEYAGELSLLAEEIDYAKCWELLDQCEVYDLPVPPKDNHEFWEHTPQTGRWVLTNNGRAHMRSLLRAEKRETFAFWEKFVIPITTAVMSLIGVVIGSMLE